MSIDVIDALVKVLIGMLLGLAIYLMLSKKRGRYPISDATGQGNDRRDQYELVAKKVGSVHYIYQQYLALIIEFTRYGAKWPAVRREELARVTNELVDAFAHLTDAESLLLLLGEKRLEQVLRSYGAKIVYIRRMIYVEKGGFTGEELMALEEAKKEVARLREVFFDGLSRRYNQKAAVKFA